MTGCGASVVDSLVELDHLDSIAQQAEAPAGPVDFVAFFGGSREKHYLMVVIGGRPDHYISSWMMLGGQKVVIMSDWGASR